MICIHVIGAHIVLTTLEFLLLHLAGGMLQIYDVDTKQKMKAHSDDKRVEFWKWVSDTTIGIVTDTSVFHWSISDATSAPQKIFDRHSSLSGAQIINYRITHDDKWQVLVGITGHVDS